MTPAGLRFVPVRASWGSTGVFEGSRCGDSRGGVEVFLGFDLHLVYTTKLFVQPMCRRTRAAPLEE